MKNFRVLVFFFILTTVHFFQAGAIRRHPTSLSIEELAERERCRKIKFDERGHDVYSYNNENVYTCYNNRTIHPEVKSLFLESAECGYVVQTFPVSKCPEHHTISSRSHLWDFEKKAVHLNRLPICSISMDFELQPTLAISLRVNFSQFSDTMGGLNLECYNICDKTSRFRYPNTIEIYPLNYIIGRFNVNLFSNSGCFDIDKITNINGNIFRDNNGLVDLTEVTRLPETLSYQIYHKSDFIL